MFLPLFFFSHATAVSPLNESLQSKVYNIEKCSYTKIDMNFKLIRTNKYNYCRGILLTIQMSLYSTLCPLTNFVHLFYRYIILIPMNLARSYLEKLFYLVRCTTPLVLHVGYHHNNYIYSPFSIKILCQFLLQKYEHLLTL